MSWMDCIERALAAKRITSKSADTAREKYQNLYKEGLADGMGDRQAQDWAATQATQQIEVDLAGVKKRKLAQMRHSIDTWNTLNKGGPKKMKANAKAFFDLEPAATPGIISYKDQVEINRGYFQRLLDGFIDKYSPKFAGLHMPKAGLENIVRELFQPGSTGDAMAASIAKAWIATTDFAVRRFNQVGGVLSNRDGWLMPQRQSAIRLYKIGMTEWVADHMGWLDWNKMRFPDGSRIDPADRERVLKEVFNTLKTGGDNKLVPGSSRGRGAAVGNKFDAHRFLVFKDADSWLAMHNKYTEGASIFETMLNHLDSMAHDMALVQVFGPNPSVGVQQIATSLKKIAATADIAEKKPPRVHGVIPTTWGDEAQKAVNDLDDTFRVITRANQAPENGGASIIAGLMGDVRSTTTSALLGSIFVWAPQDFANGVFRMRFAKLPVWRSMARYFTYMNPANKEDVKLMMRHGFINEAATRFAHTHMRITGLEAGGSRLGRRISDFVLRAGLTNWHTQSARFTTAAEFAGAMADWRNLSFDKVPLKRVMEAHGITAVEWDAMRKTPVATFKGHEFLMPDDYVRHSGLPEAKAYDLADKFMTMIGQEARMATIEGSINSAVKLKGATRQGTLSGEIMNSVSMFRSFVLTAAHWHISAGLSQPVTVGGKIGYVGGWMAAMLVSGMIGLQLQQMVRGRDPLAMFDGPDFMLRAALAGGGFSIFGDLVAGDVLGTGIDMTTAIAGPPIEFLANATSLTVGNIFEAVRGKPTHFAEEAVKFTQKWAPGTSLFYVRRALQALVWENLLRWADPQAEHDFRKQARKLKRDTGQDQWWWPGKALPSRGPDLSAAVR